jgi:hypothetical protein
MISMVAALLGSSLSVDYRDNNTAESIIGLCHIHKSAFGGDSAMFLAD